MALNGSLFYWLSPEHTHKPLSQNMWHRMGGRALPKPRAFRWDTRKAPGPRATHRPGCRTVRVAPGCRTVRMSPGCRLSNGPDAQSQPHTQGRSGDHTPSPTEAPLAGSGGLHAAPRHLESSPCVSAGPCPLTGPWSPPASVCTVAPCASERPQAVPQRRGPPRAP